MVASKSGETLLRSSSISGLPIVVTVAILLILAKVTLASLLQTPTQTQVADVVAVKEGSNLDLDCPIVVKNEDMIISWTCDNEPANIRSSRILVTESGKLRIRSAKVGDSCNYRCEAADGFGTLSVIIKVIIVDKRLIQNRKHNEAQRDNKTGNSNNNNKFKQSKSIGYSGLRDETIIEPELDLVGAGRSETDANGLEVNEKTTRQLVKSSGIEEQIELDVQVEPTSVLVAKNHTFSLRCRVRHAPQLLVPHIVWLKEFMGKKPETISEALEQNLVLIDDVYYHSLNWPRSFSYSPKTASANSALLVRQSNQVHSGKYICFAGYPPAILSSNLSSMSQPNVAGPNQKGLKYRMAKAEVKVEDGSGYLLNTGQSSGREFSSSNLLIDVVSNNSWTRNLAAFLMLTCGLMYILKLILVRYGLKSSKNQTSVESSAIQDNPDDRTSPQPQTLSLAVKQLESPYKQLPNNVKTIQMSSTLNLRQLPNFASSSASDSLKFTSNEHLYSEIGERVGIADDDIASEGYKVPLSVLKAQSMILETAEITNKSLL